METPTKQQTDKRGFRTKREAEEFLASVENMKATGEFVSASSARILLSEWARGGSALS
ncbi:Arm DNA-binding domain-containing protein [Microbacterium sp. NPDC089189]|uniref:Arm DNA-binding domain-containing protein n=1 Tax=Microbacterium sp. NPDC089189 TaxID=3154972 RepID=UPI00341D8D52